MTSTEETLHDFADENLIDACAAVEDDEGNKCIDGRHDEWYFPSDIRS